MLGELGVHPGVSFPTGEGPGGLLAPPCAGVGQGSVVRVRPPRTLWGSRASQSLRPSGASSASPPGSGVFTMVSVYGGLLVGGAGKGTEVRNDLCCHLDYITSSHLF